MMEPASRKIGKSKDDDDGFMSLSPMTNFLCSSNADKLLDFLDKNCLLSLKCDS